MGMESFYVSVKSTVDMLGALVASRVSQFHPELTPTPFTLDSPSDIGTLMIGDEPAIVWSLQRFSPSKRDPLYELIFMIGVRATADPNGELMAELLSVVYSELPVGSRVEIKNFAGNVVSTKPGEIGTMFIQDLAMQEQLYDGQAALRMAVVTAAIVREI